MPHTSLSAPARVAVSATDVTPVPSAPRGCGQAPQPDRAPRGRSADVWSALIQSPSPDLGARAVPPGAVDTDVRDWHDMTEAERSFVSRAGLDGVGPTEAWTFLSSNQKLGYATHGTYRYFGKFPPPLANRLIHEYTVPGNTVLDPMCGSGTTGVEAALAGRAAVLNDVNPLSALIARVKTTHLDAGPSLTALERVLAAARRHKADAFVPPKVKYEHWFLPETVDSLRRLRLALADEPTGRVTDLLTVAFASVVRRVSRATTQQGRLFLDAATAEKNAEPHFEKSARRLVERVSLLPRDVNVTVTCADARKIDVPSPAPLAILHPPYFNAYRYSSVNSLEMAWLGLRHDETRRSEVREFFKVGKVGNLPRYLDDMQDVLAATRRNVAGNGRVALMLGDTKLAGEHVRVVRPLLDAVAHVWQIDRLIVRVPRHTEATWAASQRRDSSKLGAQMFDFVVVLRPTFS